MTLFTQLLKKNERRIITNLEETDVKVLHGSFLTKSAGQDCHLAVIEAMKT